MFDGLVMLPPALLLDLLSLFFRVQVRLKSSEGKRARSVHPSLGVQADQPFRGICNIRNYTTVKYTIGDYPKTTAKQQLPIDGLVSSGLNRCL